MGEQAIAAIADGLSRAGLFLNADDAEVLVRALLDRWPDLAGAADVAHMPASVFIRGFLSSDPRPFVAHGAAALAIFDPEIEGLLAGHRHACLKEGVPSADVTGIIRAYETMGLSAGPVLRHGLESQSGTHGSGEGFTVIAVARTLTELGTAIQAQRESVEGSNEARLRMGLLLGYPRCCIEAFLGSTQRGDNLENERQPFLRKPNAALHPLLHRLALPRLISHHLCAPDCAESIRRAQSTLSLMRARDSKAADWVESELARPALFLDYARRARLTGRWSGSVFHTTELLPVGATDWLPQRAGPITQVSIFADHVWLEFMDKGGSPLHVTRPLLTTPGAPLAAPALDAIQPLPPAPAGPRSFLGQPLPLALTNGWRLSDAAAGNGSIQLTLHHDGQLGIVRASVARLTPGARHFRSTKLLALSYTPGGTLNMTAIVSALEALTAVLARIETETLVNQAFGSPVVSSPP